MAQSNVSSCVLSIVASFTSGLDVFKKFRELRNKKRKSRKNASLDDEEVRLARSLRQGPEDIGREYSRSIIAIGDHFAQGDVIAQTSLAEILLKLNTGLVTVINAFLSRDKHDTKLDCQSLTSLSERSRVDTCHALRQLYRRMLQQIRISRELGLGVDQERKQTRSTISDGRRRARESAASPKRTKVKGPMLARVVIADSKKPGSVAMVRPGERRKKKPTSGVSSKAQSCSSLALQTPPPQYSPPEPPTRPNHHRAQIQPERPRPQRKQSAIDVSSVQGPPMQDVLRATRSTPRLVSVAPRQVEPLPPMPHTAPLPSSSVLESRRRLQKATPTLYSIASDSTKLGEIPLHKWSEPVDFDAMSIVNKEAARNGWPVTDFDIAEQKKKRGGIFGMFRRNR